MKYKNLLILAIIASAAIAGTVYATGAYASWGTRGEEMTSKIAEKLGVDESKVSSAMDQIRQEEQTERHAEISSRLDNAVNDGVITSEQKTALVAKQEEMQQKQEALRTEMEQWYSDNGIDESKLGEYGIGGMGYGKGMGMGGGRMHGASVSSDSESSSN